MTDEQLDKLEEQTREIGGLGQTAALALIAEVRRLRELERAVRDALIPPGAWDTRWCWVYDRDLEIAATIGRLLEGKDG